jgi:predicted dienelactone hydrolase
LIIGSYEMRQFINSILSANSHVMENANGEKRLAMALERDMKLLLDQLNDIGSHVPGLSGRLDSSRIAAVGHSFGAHTVGLLLGARVISPDGHLEEDMSERLHKIV